MSLTPKPAGTWDWYGTFDPRTTRLPHVHTFSVGIFQWIPKARGNGTKRGKVVRRFRGRTSNPSAVHARAVEECQRRNKGGAA